MSAPMRQHRRNGPVTPPSARFRIPGLPLDCLQRAYSASILCQCKQECHRKTAINLLDFITNFGAGDGIRTHDPDLGKEEMAHPDTIRTCGLHLRRWRSIQLS